ncbi:sugar transferase [Patescibacteria group bacterium]|nr:sugar transferase [Patescibacteria group bacterium]MBU4579411.1 sugar transferase [Patescibacteria group bacterium]
MKKAELVFNMLLVPVDFSMFFLAGVAAYFLRFNKSLTDIRPVVFDLPFASYAVLALAAAFFFTVIFSLLGLYSFKTKRKLREDFSKILIGVSLGVLTLVFFTFLTRDLFSSRFIILAAWLFAITFVFAGRIILEKIRKRMIEKYGYGVHKVLVIGQNQASVDLIREFQSNPSLGYRPVLDKKQFSMDSFKKNYNAVKFDEVIVADLSIPRSILAELLDYCQVYHIDFKFIPDLFQTKTIDVDIETIKGVTLVEIKKTPLDGWGKIIKRVFDIVGAILGIIIFSPIMLLAALILKLESKGPVLYYSERVGAKGNFDVLKFRSMKLSYCTGRQFGAQNEHALQYEKKLIKEKNSRQGAVYKIKDDPRVTSFGKFMRRASIDELPQLFNVLMGQMSLVGPRPHQAREVEKNGSYYRKNLEIKPGITGLAQVGGRSDLSTNEEFKLDSYYLSNWSFWLDVQILFKTIPAVINKREAE